MDSSRFPLVFASAFLASSCALFGPHRPDVGDLSAPLFACRAYEDLPAERRTREAFLAFWLPADAEMIRGLERHIEQTRADFAGLRAELAAALPEFGVQAWRGGFRTAHAGVELGFPLDAVSLAELYAASGSRPISFGSPMVLGDAAVVPVILERGPRELSMRRVGGRWLRVLDGPERLLILAQRDFLTAQRNWIEGVRRDLREGALISETADSRLRAYAGLLLAIRERYLGRN